jgi:hypothetical protein
VVSKLSEENASFLLDENEVNARRRAARLDESIPGIRKQAQRRRQPSRINVDAIAAGRQIVESIDAVAVGGGDLPLEPDDHTLPTLARVETAVVIRVDVGPASNGIEWNNRQVYDVSGSASDDDLLRGAVDRILRRQKILSNAYFVPPLRQAWHHVAPDGVREDDILSQSNADARNRLTALVEDATGKFASVRRHIRSPRLPEHHADLWSESASNRAALKRRDSPEVDEKGQLAGKILREPAPKAAAIENIR